MRGPVGSRRRLRKVVPIGRSRAEPRVDWESRREAEQRLYERYGPLYRPAAIQRLRAAIGLVQQRAVELERSADYDRLNVAACLILAIFSLDEQVPPEVRSIEEARKAELAAMNSRKLVTIGSRARPASALASGART